MGQLTLIFGGARSGKSTFAQRLAVSHGGRVAFIATAQAGDPEMASRIAAHQRERSFDWLTLEIPVRVASAWRAQSIQVDLAILDCLTLLVSNLALQATPDVDSPDEQQVAALVTGEIEALIALIEGTTCDWIVVSNEVGLGLVPSYPLGRVFRDWLGWANQRLASAADQIYLLIAGIPVPIHPYKKSD